MQVGTWADLNTIPCNCAMPVHNYHIEGNQREPLQRFREPGGAATLGALRISKSEAGLSTENL